MKCIEAIKKPFSNTKTLSIGTIIGAIPVVQFLLVGYVLKTFGETMKGKSMPAEWKNFPELIIKSILGIIIFFLYSIPATLIMLLAVTPVLSLKSIAGAADFAESLAALLGSGSIALYLGMLVALVTALMVPMALAAFAKSGKFSEAFALGKIFKKSTSLPGITAFVYCIVWFFVYTAVIALIAYSVIEFLWAVPLLALVISALFGGFWNFTLLTTMATWYGEAFKKAK